MAENNTNEILKVGVLLFPQYEILDIAGPMETWCVLERVLGKNLFNLITVAEQKGEVSSGPFKGSKSNIGEHFGQKIIATESFDSCPQLDVLLVPGGLGAGDSTYMPPGIDKAAAFIKNMYPSLKWLITVCTGSGIAARAGVLDGLVCTTNKFRWGTVPALGPKTYWEASARWVVSDNGKVWTSSGVSAGTDCTIAWIAAVYGEDLAETTCLRIEYERQPDRRHDPFAQKNGCEDIPPKG